MNGADDVLFTLFAVLFWLAFMTLSFGGLLLALAAIWSAARLPAESFGPWWDNTKSAWLLGIGVGFLVPCGSVVTGVYWFRTGRRSLKTTGLVARPFWIGPPKPPPPAYWGAPPPSVPPG